MNRREAAPDAGADRRDDRAGRRDVGRRASRCRARTRSTRATSRTRRVKSKDIKPERGRAPSTIKGKSIKGSDVQDDALKGKQIFEDKLEAGRRRRKTRADGDRRSATRCSSASTGDRGRDRGRARRRAAAQGRRWSSKGHAHRSTRSASATRPPTQLFGEIYVDERPTAGAILRARPATTSSRAADAATSSTRAPPEDDRELATETVDRHRRGVQPGQRRAAGARSAPDGTGAHRDLDAVAVKNGNARRRQRRLRRGQRLPVRRRRDRLSRLPIA